MSNLIGSITPLTKTQTIYYNIARLPTPPITSGYVLNAVNNETIGLYYQAVTTVTLASGSTASISGASQNLGSVGSGGNATFYINPLYTINTNPSTNEVETITLTIKRYTDSGYSNLYDTSSTTLSLHLYSDSFSTVSVIETDNFANNSFSGWSSNLSPTTGHYYDATSGYTLWAITSFNALPFNNIILYKAFSVANTYTDALAELYIKVDGQGFIAIQVSYSDNSPSDYYLFQVPNTSNWFPAIVHLKPGLTNTIALGGFYGYGLTSATIQDGNFYQGLYLGTARIIGKSSGTF
jgi:hypothetical protein